MITIDGPRTRPLVTPHWRRRAPLALALCIGATTPALPAASFDCARADTVVERAICASPRLSRLDAELATAYRQALAETADRQELKVAQRRWLRTTRTGCGGATDCLEQAMLERLELLRWSPESGVEHFADQPPPASIFGRYSKTEPVCIHTGSAGELDCSGTAESYVDLQQGDGHRVRVRSELTFFNGHMCTFEADGEWAGDELRAPSDLEDVGCVLIIRFRDNKLVTDDPGTRCKAYCGMRGGYRQIELPKLPAAEAEAKRRATP